MAILREVNQESGLNDAAISSGASTSARYPGRLRVRLSDADRGLYGPWNTFRFHNKSSQKVRIHWTWGIDNDKFEDMAPNSIRNITIDDGVSSYGFDVENLDATTDIAIGNFQWKASRVEQIAEGR